MCQAVLWVQLNTMQAAMWKLTYAAYAVHLETKLFWPQYQAHQSMSQEVTEPTMFGGS